jgi:nitrite reductase/ring-hydroxylating ferredoxin subunit
VRLYKTKAVPDAHGFFDTVSVDSVLPDQMVVITINGKTLILTRWEDKLYALDGVCPHAAGDMTEGWVSRWKVTCPDHDYCFDIRNGRILWPEDEMYRLKQYEVKEEDGMAKVRLEGD